MVAMKPFFFPFWNEKKHSFQMVFWNKSPCLGFGILLWGCGYYNWMFIFKKHVLHAKAIWKARIMMMTISSGSNDLIACGSQEFEYKDPHPYSRKKPHLSVLGFVQVMDCTSWSPCMHCIPTHWLTLDLETKQNKSLSFDIFLLPKMTEVHLAHLPEHNVQD